MKFKRWEIVAVILILVISGFCRLYRIPDYMTFLGDEGRDVLVIRDIVLGKHFPLIGPGTSVGNMYLGPLYYYLVAPSLLLSGFSPVGPAVEVALIGLATVVLLWWMTRPWFGRVIALSISFLYGLSPLVITYSRSSWNPNIMPFFALLAMYGTWQFWRYQTKGWLMVIAVSLAFVLNSHYLGLLLFPVAAVFILLSKNIFKSKNILFSSVFIFLLLMSPLLIFDMRHNWANLNALKIFLTQRESTVNFKAYKALPNIWPIWQDIVSNLLSPRNQIFSILLAVIIGIFTLLQILKKKITPEFLFVLIWLFAGLVGLGLYKQHIYVHYYGFLFPVPFILLGFLFKSLKTGLSARLLSLTIFLSVFIIFIQANPFNFSANLQLQRTTEIAEFITDQSKGLNFNLALLSKTNYDAGYRYMFELLNSPYFTIHDRVTDQLYVICEIPDCKPVGNPLWEIAAFGWARIDKVWNFPWAVTVYRLVHNPTGS